ncbi:hypothetical protein [Plantactinospora sp. DSM 117369]
MTSDFSTVGVAAHYDSDLLAELPGAVPVHRTGAHPWQDANDRAINAG